MLPSTGYFKAINCPFYENGYCERPYCHFRHSRRDASTTGASSSDSSHTVSSQKTQNATTSSITATKSQVIEKLVSEAVKKVLADQNVIDTENIVNKVVENLKIDPAVLSSASQQELPAAQSLQCIYNPTPISELKKRHIPVSTYEPTRETKVIKRKPSDSEKPWMDVIRNINSEPISKKIKYKPTAISQNKIEPISTHEYVPTIKTESSLNLYEDDEEYIPSKKKKKESYFPKSKKRREEYVPRKPKIPLKDGERIEDDSFDVLDELLCGSTPKPTTSATQQSQSNEDVENSHSDTDSSHKNVVDLTKDEESQNLVKQKSIINENIETMVLDDETNSNDSNDSNQVNEEISGNEVISGDNTSKDINKVTDKINKEDLKYSKENSKSSKENLKQDKDDSKQDREDSKNCKVKNKECLKYNKYKEDSRLSKYQESDIKHSKNKDKEKEDRKEKEKSKEKDKHSSKSNDKERSSSTKDVKSKEKDKDSRSSSHRSKSKDSKSNKEKGSSSSKDTKNSKKDSKDKSKHKTDDKDRHKSKSNSLESKHSKSSKSSRKSSEKHDSYSSHKSTKSSEKHSTETEDSVSDKNEEKSDKEEYEEYEEFSPIYDEQFLEPSDSDDDVEEECRKIFQEYQVSDQPKDVTSKIQSKPEVEDQEDVSKKRVAHSAADLNFIKPVGPSQPVKRLPNPHQRMYERFRLIREAAAEKAAVNKTHEVGSNKKVLEHSSTVHHDHQVNGNGRIRIAQVPYAMSLALEKKKMMEQAAKVASKTPAQNKKGGERVAHIPQVVPQLIRPEPLQISGTQKFPVNARQFYVNAMQDICIQIYTNADDAAQRAVREEHICYEKCKALNVYKNSCMLTVHRLRKEVDQKEEPTTSFGSISHESVLAGKSKGTWSVIKPKKLVTDIKGALLYKKLSKWIMTEQELRDNGYPRPHPDGPKGRAKLYITNTRGQSTSSKVPNERYCCRCNKSYMVDKYGFSVRQENCIYHYARKFTFRGESKYMCCKQDGSSDGCCDATTHVWDYIDVDNLRGYVSTFDKDDSNPSVFALDCEMCYTTQGLELTRVTVINEECQVVFETLIKPPHPIIDYNTRFSGITEKDMTKVTTTLLDVQATLLSMFSSKSILIGHSLESDFKALKLLHNTVVDTSVMFPHKNGPPFKRALKTLCSEYLRKIIQNDVSGHDSKEDAVSCMELVLWKVKEEAKLQ